jgi:DNA-binding winged helix-turn-helix (wHTH) protein
MQESNSDNSNESVEQTRSKAVRRLLFEDFEFFPLEMRLTFRGDSCNLEPKMLQLLLLLIDARPQVLTKDHLMAKLWPDAVVSDWSLARLVSDTRKIIDIDRTNSLIKTVRGKGFRFDVNVDEIIEAYPSNGLTGEQVSQSDIISPTASNVRENVLNSKFDNYPRLSFRLIIASIVFMLVITAAAYWGASSSRTLSQEQHHSSKHHLEVMFEIQKNLRLTKTAYLTQARRRNELKASLLLKIPESVPLSSEKRMRLHFPHLTNDEKFIFDQIRALTEGPMYQGNTAILMQLDEHPEIYREIELFVTLYNHLNIWKNKYHRVFENRPDMGFVFVGEEDGLPFPKAIDGLVDQWIEKRLLEKPLN